MRRAAASPAVSPGLAHDPAAADGIDADRVDAVVEQVDILTGHRLGIAGRTAGPGGRVVLRHSTGAATIAADAFVHGDAFSAVLALSPQDGSALGPGSWTASWHRPDGTSAPLRAELSEGLRRPLRVRAAGGDVLAVAVVAADGGFVVQVDPAAPHAELRSCRWDGDALDLVVEAPAVAATAAASTGPPSLWAVGRESGAAAEFPLRARVDGTLGCLVPADVLASAGPDGVVWDLFLELRPALDGGDDTGPSVGPAGARLRVAGHLDGIPDKKTAVHYPARAVAVDGSRRLLTPYFTLENGLSITCEAAAPSTARTAHTARTESTAAASASSVRAAEPPSPAPASVAPAPAARPRRTSARRRVRRIWRKRTRSVRRLLWRALSAASVAVVRRSVAAAEPPRGTPARPRIAVLLLDAYAVGGTVRSVFNVCSVLVQWYDVEVVSVRRGRDTPFFAFPPGVTVRTLDDQRRSAARRGPIGLAQRRLAGRPSALIDPDDRAHELTTAWTDVLLRAYLPGSRADVVMGTRIALNAVVARLAPASAATVGQVHTSYPGGAGLRRVIRETHGSLDAIAALSGPDLAAYAEAIAPRAPLLTTIPNAVTPMGGSSTDASRPVMVAAGRLATVKRFDLLVEAFAPVAEAHPEWTLQIYGGGTTAPVLRRRIRDLVLHDHVFLMGTTRHLGAELERASVYALSSRSEGFPMVLIEAMGKGVPPVTFECSASVREIITDGVDGLVVPNGDVTALTGALLRLVEDDALRRRMGAAALQRSAAFELAAVGRQWRELVDSVLETTSGRRARG